MDMSKYLDVFIEETKEYLHDLNLSLLQLETNPKNSSVINEMFRLAHTIKGMAGTLGFEKIARLTHNMEDILEKIRSNKKVVDNNLVDILFKALDFLEDSLEVISKTGSEGSEIFSLFEDHKQEDLQFNKYEQNLIYTATDMGMNSFTVTITLDSGCVLKSARAFVIFKTVEKYGEIIKSIPVTQDIEDEKFENEFTLVVISKVDKNILLKSLKCISEVEKVVIKEEEVKDRIIEDTSVKTKSEEKIRKAGKTVRVDIERLDILLNLVSELIIQKTRLTGLENNEKSSIYEDTLEQLERITGDLHDAVMKVRMVPIETVFNRFPRMIRDAAKELGKEIELKMSGEDTELDRIVIDEIGEPLIHLLRNSADHGLESIEERQKLGKSKVGQINLRAFQDGSNVIIEVEDDGRGFDFEKIKSKALERNLISTENLSTLTEQMVIEFLFTPGFSTSSEITDLSGRGVGLDVVRTKIQSLGGTIEVATKSGKGSKFTIRLPLTLSIMKALMVFVGEEKYAIKMSSIQHIVEISPSDIKIVQKQEALFLRDTLVPIIRLNMLLNSPSGNENADYYTVVIVKKGEKLTGLMVDSTIGQQEVVQKPLDRYLSSVGIAKSATILGDGNVALILDVDYIMQ